MRATYCKGVMWLALAAAMLVLTAAAPLAAAAGAELRAAPPSAEFLRYQADFKVRHTLGLDRVPGFRPGLVPAPMDVTYLKGTRQAAPLAAFPSSYDLRALARVTSVKDQGQHGTCWAFASMGSLESSLLPTETQDFSEDNMVLTSGFNYPGTLYDAGGNSSMSTAYLVRWDGPVNEGEDIYGDGLTPPDLAPRKHVQDVSWIPPRATALDNDAVKSALVQHGGVYAAMGWYGSYYKASTDSYYYGGSGGTNHAVLIVGWDDHYPATNFATIAPGNGAFIVKNSWGPSWGSQGYFYVSYYDAAFGRDDLMAVFDNAESTSTYDDIYQYDPLGDCSERGYSSSTGWFANVFTARTTASVGAVGFYTLAPGTSYEVYTGSSLETKTLSTNGTLATMGYHTVTLPTAVGITSGQEFVVAVKVTSPGATYPIAIEAPYAGYSSAATAEAGQSYLSPSGSLWTDLTSVTADANVCLKAYVTGSSPTPVDSTPPVTTASGHDANWHNTPVTVRFSAVDPGAGASGVAYTEYRIDGGAWTHGVEVTVGAPTSGGGTRTVDYRSADNAGNVEEFRSLDVKLDVLGPVCRARSASVTRGGLAAVSLCLTDNVSPNVKSTVQVRTTTGTVKLSITSSSWRDAGVWRTWRFICRL
ncbi:MAG TPA: lectin like domain-containing protein, partial [Thermoleophilia bacterium]